MLLQLTRSLNKHPLAKWDNRLQQITILNYPNTFSTSHTLFGTCGRHLHCNSPTVFSGILKEVKMFGDVIRSLALLPPPTIVVIQWLYHTLLTKMTQNPGGVPLIHVTPSHAVWCKLCTKNIVKSLPQDII